MKTLVSTAIVLLSLGQTGSQPATPQSTGVWPSTQAGRPPEATAQPEPPVSATTPAATPVRPPVMATSPTSSAGRLASLLADTTVASGPQSLWEQACEAVLVVPTPELSPQSLAQITEDMTVMCHILDKAVAPTLLARYAIRYQGMAPRALDDGAQTQGLYLGGYGALFFLQVDFPLRPAQPEPTPSPGEPAADPLWSQTVEELRGSPAAGRPTMAPVPPYDAQKVENLKSILAKSLRHAANMRLASAQDVITLVVGPQEGAIRFSISGAGPNPQTTYGYYSDRRSRVELRLNGGAPPESTTALVLRVSKADVDAFAQGTLTLDQFTGKVQFLWSWASPRPAPAPAPSQTLVLPQYR
jgi:hypothetical protein